VASASSTSSLTWTALAFRPSSTSCRHNSGQDLALLQLDQCSVHCAQTLEWSDNIIPIFQPAHSPELNPIERVWQALKRPLRWQNYPSREAVTEVLETLTPEHLMSLTSYDFALEALLSAAL